MKCVEGIARVNAGLKNEEEVRSEEGLNAGREREGLERGLLKNLNLAEEEIEEDDEEEDKKEFS